MPLYIKEAPDDEKTRKIYDAVCAILGGDEENHPKFLVLVPYQPEGKEPRWSIISGNVKEEYVQFMISDAMIHMIEASKSSRVIPSLEEQAKNVITE